ncbi:MAG: RHS repeat protein [Candidatus Marithrix sp.]
MDTLLHLSNILNQLSHPNYLLLLLNANRISQTDHAGQITRFKYNAQQQLVKVILPKGATTIYTYQLGQLITITNAKGKKQTFGYDKAGRMISMKDENGKTTSLTYDPLDRIASITDPLNRTVEMTLMIAGIIWWRLRM